MWNVIFLTRKVERKTSKPCNSALYLHIRNQLSSNVHIEDYVFYYCTFGKPWEYIFQSKCELRNFWLVIIIKNPMANARISD